MYDVLAVLLLKIWKMQVMTVCRRVGRVDIGTASELLLAGIYQRRVKPATI